MKKSTQNVMKRCSSHSLKFTNVEKLCILHKTLDDYQTVLSAYIDIIIQSKNLQMISIPPTILSTFTSSGWKQICYKDATEVVKSQLALIKKNVYKRYGKAYAKCKRLKKHKKFTKLRFSELKIDWKRLKKPELKNCSIIIDYRILDIERGKSFDNFYNLRLPYQINPIKHHARCLSIKLPIKNTKVSNKFKDWTLCKSVKIQRDNRNQLYLVKIYEKEIPEKKTIGTSIGVDRGYKKLLAVSDGKTYGDFKSLYERLARCKRGSKRYKRLLKFRTDETNRETKRLISEHQDVKDIVVEDLINIKNKSKLNTKFLNKMQYWSVAQTTKKLEMLSESEGFNLVQVSPSFTSQICSKCGFKHVDNRKLELFKCLNCGMEMDADLNASINILHRGVYGLPTQEKEINIDF